MIFIFVFALIMPRFNSEETITIETSGRGAFKNAIDVGILIPGKTNFTFSVKTCAEAVIVFSDVVVVAASTGNYFLVMLGTEENKRIVITDSCFRCNRSKAIDAKIMECDKFLDFWSRFDLKGTIEIGRGKTIGENSLITFKGTHSKVYNVYNIAFTSTNENKAIWKILKEELEPSLYQPVEKGHTIVEMTDADKAGCDVIEIIVMHDRRPEKFSLVGNTSDLFTIEGNAVKLNGSLSLTQPFHIVRIRSDGGFATAFTVVVKEFIPLPDNSKPVVKVDDVISIPEDTPIGTVIGWNLTVIDVDQHDVAILNISGVLSDYFSISQDGRLTLVRTLDREAFDQQPSFMLTVTDVKPNVVNVTIKVNISDVNDNSPECEKDLFVLKVEEMPEQDKEILTLLCTDKDEGPNGRLELSLVEDQESLSSFFISNTSLFVKSGGLDYETSHVITVLVSVRDSPGNDLPNTITVIVIIKVQPKDESEPAWISPEMTSSQEFLDVYLPIGSPPGSLVTSFAAMDEDEGEGDITYSLDSTETGFQLEKQTGQLTLLDGIGDDAFNFDLEVFAKSGERQIRGVIKVHFVDSVESTVQHQRENTAVHFNRDVYVIDRPLSRDWRISLLNFQLVNQNLRGGTNVSIIGKGGNYFRLRFSLSSWKLYLKRKAKIEDIPPSLELTASVPQGYVSAHVLIRDRVAVCDVPVTTSTTSQVTVSKNIRPATTSPISKRRERKCTIQDDTSEQLLVTLIVGQSLGLAAIFLLRNSFQTRTSHRTRKRHRKLKTKPKAKKVKRPKRKAPLGCETEIMLREFVRKTSIPKVFENSEGPLTLAEIGDIEESVGVVDNENGEASDNKGANSSVTQMIEAVDNPESNDTSGSKVKDDAGSLRPPPTLEALEVDDIENRLAVGDIDEVKPNSDGTVERGANTAGCPPESGLVSPGSQDYKDGGKMMPGEIGTHINRL